jgi:hypothetical protein
MRAVICVLALLTCVASCATSKDDTGERDRSTPVSVRITSTNDLSRPAIAICNNTKSELRVWYNGNMWGYWNLSYCVAMDDGHVIHLQRRKSGVGFTANAAIYEAIAPDCELARNDDNLLDGYWDIPKNLNLDKVRYICAVFFVEPTKESKEKGVWTGMVVSPWVRVGK